MVGNESLVKRSFKLLSLPFVYLSLGLLSLSVNLSLPLSLPPSIIFSLIKTDQFLPQYWEFHPLKYFTRYHLSPIPGNFLFLITIYASENILFWKTCSQCVLYLEQQREKERTNSDTSMGILQMVGVIMLLIFYHGSTSIYLQLWQKVFWIMIIIPCLN